jgi:hypothetical protein
MCITVLGSCLAFLSGCQSLSNTNFSARVRVIDLSPDAPALDVYQENNAVAYNLSFGTVTSYVSVPPGVSTFTVAPSGSRQVLSSVKGMFHAGALYTVLVNSSLATMQPVILTDRGPLPASSTAPAASVRLIDQAPQSGPVDVYLVPAGQRITSVQPLVTNLVPGSNTGYLTIPVCTCAAVMLPAGTVPAARLASHIETQTTYNSDAARTLILLDSPPASPSGMQVISTVDADSSN